MSNTPAWVLVATAGAVLLVLLGMTYVTGRGLWRASERTRKRRQAEQDKAKAEGLEAPEKEGLGLRLIVMALGGMSVSLYGMWGFATEQAKLPELFAIGFLAMFDLTELTLFTLLYKRANPKLGWTSQLRLMHNTAWGLVLVSAAANWIHAPSATAAPFLAVMPVTAAWVIELEFRARMRGTEVVADEKAGPVKLASMLWEKGWAALFAGLDLDPSTKNGQIIRAALAKKASRRLFRLRTLLERHAKLIEAKQAKRRDLSAAVTELEKARRKATRAMDRSDFAVDSSQALAVLRGLAGWTRVDDVATVDTSDTPAVTQLMEEVAILPSAARIENAERAAELEAEAERAAELAAEAEAARQRAEEAMRAAVEERSAAEAARKEAEAALQKAAEETAAAKAEAARAETARERAEAARRRAESEMTEDSRNVAKLAERAEAEQNKLSAAAGELARVQGQIADETSQRNRAAAEAAKIREELQRLLNDRTSAKDAVRDSEDEARQVAEKVQRLQAALADAQRLYGEHKAAAERAAELRSQAEDKQRLAVEEAARTQAEAAEAQALLESLRPQLAERLGGETEAAALAAAPAFRSPAKQAGWEEYIAAVREGRELPTASELATVYEVSEGNARNWLLDFGKVRAGMIANGGARQGSGASERSADSHALPRGARQVPSEGRADGHERVEDAAHPRPINGQRQPV
ncbi:hypothetical protein [Streptomyces sp. NBC_01304]|uniref:hypothetical protein n=1 Tax=Streptomyces sp. NBC_01304 TaxID=2903818 RepID=UPI002E0F1F5F|nr:hypothetical protein OG430_49150 [Streptomyces sp. NBC_01304]